MRVQADGINEDKRSAASALGSFPSNQFVIMSRDELTLNPTSILNKSKCFIVLLPVSCSAPQYKKNGAINCSLLATVCNDRAPDDSNIIFYF